MEHKMNYQANVIFDLMDKMNEPCTEEQFKERVKFSNSEIPIGKVEFKEHPPAILDILK